LSQQQEMESLGDVFSLGQFVNISAGLLTPEGKLILLYNEPGLFQIQFSVSGIMRNRQYKKSIQLLKKKLKQFSE